MRQVNIHEAKTHFSELIAAVERGETIIIARRGKPVAEISGREASAAVPKKKRVFGQWAGKIWVDPALFEPRTDEELEEMYPDLEALVDVARAQSQRQTG